MQWTAAEMTWMRQMVLQLARCANCNELYFRLRYGTAPAPTQPVVDAITTHETTVFAPVRRSMRCHFNCRRRGCTRAYACASRSSCASGRCPAAAVHGPSASA